MTGAPTATGATTTATRVFVARHGQSTWNADGRWQGQADPPLSDLGARQAQVAASLVAAVVAPDAVVSSDLVRAHQTATALAAPLGLGVGLDHRLRERDAGEWTGLTRPEIEARFPGFLAEDRRPAGYEDDDALLARARCALADLHAARPGSTVLVVSHGGVIRTLERGLGALPEPIPNLAGRWLTVADDVVRLGERRLLVDADEVAVTIPRQP